MGHFGLTGSFWVDLGLLWVDIGTPTFSCNVFSVQVLTVDFFHQRNSKNPSWFLGTHSNLENLRGGHNNTFYTNAFLQIRNNEFLKIQVNLSILRIRNNEFYLRTLMPNEFLHIRAKPQ